MSTPAERNAWIRESLEILHRDTRALAETWTKIETAYYERFTEDDVPLLNDLLNEDAVGRLDGDIFKALDTVEALIDSIPEDE